MSRQSAVNHLRWIKTRLVEIHGENPNVDYMLCLDSVIDEMNLAYETLKLIANVYPRLMDDDRNRRVMVYPRENNPTELARNALKQMKGNV